MSRVKARPAAEASRYINRELSWLAFNARVLAEAKNTANPLLERTKFLAIFESNLDEFYMVRVSGLIEQFVSNVLETSPDGLTPTDQLDKIADVAGPLRREAGRVLTEEITPALHRSGIHILPVGELTGRQRRDLESYFQREIFPLVTPVNLRPANTLPFISNRSLNLLIELEDGPNTRLSRLKVPTVVPRLVPVPGGRKHDYVLLEELIREHVDTLHPGVPVLGVYVFRMLRDADVEIRELEAADLIASIEETLRLRRFGDPVLLQWQPDMPAHLRQVLMELLNLEVSDTMEIPGMLGLEALWEVARIDKPTLRYPPHVPYLADGLSTWKGLFREVADGDILVHQPYDSFRSVESFVASAAEDPEVLGIKQTLYRVGTESPIVESLSGAADKGKQVAAMVELKARFDESNNLTWARALERAGVHVTYGFRELKTHCKLSLVVRREHGHVKRYAHIGTGNYNPSTARLYTDLGLFTCDEEICQDISELFNYLTGYSRQSQYRKLLVAPVNLREGILDRIRREAEHAREGRPARIMIKVNALVDPEVVEACYDASQAGAPVDLIVRGVCCLRPGVPGLSETIRVISIVGRFLEHSRIYYFENGGRPDVFIGSADAMRRNLDRRVEVLAPVEDPRLIAYLRDGVMGVSLRDNVRAWDLDADGVYTRRCPAEGERALDSQVYFMKHPATRELDEG